MMGMKNPKIIHRVYCPSFKPFYDPYMRYLDSWKREMPNYDIIHWNESNISPDTNEWLRKCYDYKSPVYISEYARWSALRKFGGLYLDADCEILDGKILSGIVSELYETDDYDVVFGIEAKENGYPTAQTVAAKPGSELSEFMCDLYENRLPPLFNWRDSHALIGPRLMGLYMLEKGINLETDGFFVGLDEPVVIGRMKIYPQTYFSPKFSLLGKTLDFQEGKTCVYHMFGNANVDFSKRKMFQMEKARTEVLTFSEYREQCESLSKFPRTYDFSHFSSKIGEFTESGLKSEGIEGTLAYGPYIELPIGNYSCKFMLSAGASSLNGVRISVTCKGGRNILASNVLQDGTKDLRLNFTITEADAQQIEFIVECASSNAYLTFKGVIVDVREPEDNPQDILQLSERSGYLRRVLKKLGR